MNYKKVNIVLLDGKIEKDVKVEYTYEFYLEINNKEYPLHLIYDSDGKLKGFVYNNKDLFHYIIKNLSSLNLPATIQDYFRCVSIVEPRRITWVNAGGNASQSSISNKISIPRKWLELMDITEKDRDVIMIFDGEKITIQKK